jgi:hypothetical protein
MAVRKMIEQKKQDCLGLRKQIAQKQYKEATRQDLN